MATFFEGSVQDGIALAVRETKAVVCFVRDDAQTSFTWEEEYFSDERIAPALDTNAVLLRITAGSQEAGFLTSFCPIAKLPTVVVIKNGSLQEYLVPELSKHDFQTRLASAVKGRRDFAGPQSQDRDEIGGRAATGTPVSSSQNVAISIPNTTSSQHTYTSSQTASATNIPMKKSSDFNKSSEKNAEHDITTKTLSHRGLKYPALAGRLYPPLENVKPKPPVARGPPTQYRLQVRLFDGSSVRSSFAPTQTIRSDVRLWLDRQMNSEQRPYNLKHILTPLPSHTLSVSDESLTLQELGLGSTANLVMVPVSSYIEAYSTTGSSLPFRGISAAYNMVASVANTASGVVGSLIGNSWIGSNASNTGSSLSQGESVSPSGTPRSRVIGANIRTLRENHFAENDKQFYNGNQLNFEPREDEKDD
ncbi:uncharacterized protein N7483_007742 [Penicillium malachiteum]|uniref:uncharacterized protein n=1 Tax=Penicillium malachiteum TaxID=1324776 RepID=UPI0025481045|nr:uncharacterized protein N7483_007742 [Penicillium malachiteum]KAJ5726385.1 hypothetical protein N7483_007742 [Penicillium malachiteum]